MHSLFFEYVTRNVAAMIGVSAYFFVDTFFIALCSGADGITILNLVLPVYGLIYAIGAMIGIGSATCFSLKKGASSGSAEGYFTNALAWQIILSVPFVLLGIFIPGRVLAFMGGDAGIVAEGEKYIRIVLIATPAFMFNSTFNAFTRNDNAPTVAMVAALGSSAFNILFDYIFMFPLGMGLPGAALATGISPLVACAIYSTHIFSSGSNVRLHKIMPSPGLLFASCRLGVSAFVGEISSAVTITVFNFLLLAAAGNLGVAAYGIVANLALIATAIFNGLANGMQPLVSTSFGNGRKGEVRSLLRLGIITAVLLEVIMISVAFGFTGGLTGIFNADGNRELAGYADRALKLYFTGYAFAGINIVMTTFFSAIGAARSASVTSLLRGVLLIVVCGVVMSKIWGLDGIWLSFAATEAIASIVIMTIFAVMQIQDKKIPNSLNQDKR
ncbi:MATE family efflux transporter [bacterium]|nr:MATE family efflux transporter [bacterium]